MNPRLFILLAALQLILNGAVADDLKQKSVRQVFVPEKNEKGASWSALHRGGPHPDSLWLQAWAGVGDTFIVQEEGGPILFEVVTISGTDDLLLLEVRSKEKSQKVELARDKNVMVEIAGGKYDLTYPSTSVAAVEGKKPTTNQVMLILSRQP